MRTPAAALVLIALGLGAPSAAGAEDSPRPQEGGSGALQAEVFEPPTPVPATDGRRHLVYELLVGNTTGEPVRVERVDVRDRRRGVTVASYGRGRLDRLMFNFTGAMSRTLGPGESAVLPLDVRLRVRHAVPSRLIHRLKLTLSTAGQRRVVRLGRVRVGRRGPVALSPPLRGDNLAVFGCCGPPFGHRLALSEIDGRRYLAQRYAIDFAQSEGENGTFAGDPTRNESYFIFGDEVYAVASGRVAAIRDGVPENTPPGAPPDPTIETAAGNYVTLDLGGGRFAFYAHLQPGSLTVAPGDVVRRGQRLGRVGNTGNSTQPHLHFHVMDGRGGTSGLAANGRPYVFDAFRLQARLTGLDTVPPQPDLEPVSPARQFRNRYPLTGDIVAFP